VSVAPGQYLASWEPESGSLFLPAFSEASLGEDVAVQVALDGKEFRATLLGQVALVRRVGRPSLPPGAELRLDLESRRAAEWLAAAAAGKPVDVRTRQPRFAAAHGLVVLGEHPLPVRTVNVSSDGAALRWAGPPPARGELVTLRLRRGFLAPTAEAVVAWVEPAESGPSRVGVRIVADGRAARAWAQLAEEAERSGACVL
jgi:Tfp pilus assembly protein PilZ